MYDINKMFSSSVKPRSAASSLMQNGSDPLNYPDIIGRDTLGLPLSVLASDPVFRRLAGAASRQPSVPTVLTRGIRYPSLTDAVPFVVLPSTSAPFLSSDYTVPGYLATRSRQYVDSNSGVVTVERPRVIPSLSDLSAYRKLVSDVMAQLYSQSPRQPFSPAVTLPINQASVVGASGGSMLDAYPFLTTGDCIDIDPSTLLRLAKSYNQPGVLFSPSGPYADYFHLGVDSVKSGSSLNQWTSLVSPGSSIGVQSRQTYFIEDMESSYEFFEFMRQASVSPYFHLIGSNRPSGPLPFSTAAMETFPSPTDPSWPDGYFRSAQALPNNQSKGGKGLISVNINMAIYNQEQAVLQDYRGIDFCLSFVLNPDAHIVEALVPFGASVSSIFQPGFKLPSYQLTPIPKSGPGTFRITTDLLFSGVASNMAWSLGIANPSSPLLPILSS